MTSLILKVKKRFGYPPDLEETPLANFFKLRNSKFLVFGWNVLKFESMKQPKIQLQTESKEWHKSLSISRQENWW